MNFFSTIKGNNLKATWLVLIISGLLFTGCIGNPPEIVRVNNIESPVNNISQPVSDGKFHITANSSHKGIQFSSIVNPQNLTQKNPPKGQHLTVNLVTERPDVDSIKIPATGTFKVIFTGGGGRVVITDNDATDGEARVSMPSGRFDGYLQNRGEPNNKMTFEDKLYYIKQDIARDKGQPVWWNVGKRELPIPLDWHSDDGGAYVLTITNAGVTNISTQWYSTQEAADIPPGIKKIGAAGGLVDLPGVGSLNIPQGAISQPTTIVMKQVLQANELESFAYVSPMVKLYPEGLIFAKPALIRLNIDSNKVKSNYPAMISYLTKQSNEDDTHWKILYEKEEIENATLDRWVYIEHLTDVVSVIDGEVFNLGKELNMRPIKTGHFVLFWALEGNDGISHAKAQEYGDLLEKAWNHYSSLQDKLPLEWACPVKDWNTGKATTAVPVLIGAFPFYEPDTTGKTSAIAEIASIYETADIGTPYKITLSNTANSRAVTTYHEAYHLFQFAYLKISDHKNIGNSTENRWIYESSAKYMGFKKYYDESDIDLNMLIYLYHKTEGKYGPILLNSVDSLGIRYLRIKPGPGSGSPDDLEPGKAYKLVVELASADGKDDFLPTTLIALDANDNIISEKKLEKADETYKAEISDFNASIKSVIWIATNTTFGSEKAGINYTYNVYIKGEFPPIITEVIPPAGKIGDTITITGQHFNPAPGNNTIKFYNESYINLVNASTASPDGTQLTFIVPQGAIGGLYNLKVRTCDIECLESNPKDFEVIAYGSVIAETCDIALDPANGVFADSWDYTVVTASNIRDSNGLRVPDGSYLVFVPPYLTDFLQKGEA